MLSSHHGIEKFWKDKYKLASHAGDEEEKLMSLLFPSELFQYQSCYNNTDRGW